MRTVFKEMLSRIESFNKFMAISRESESNMVSSGRWDGEPDTGKYEKS